MLSSGGLTREGQDNFAAWSQQKAENAIQEGKFKEEIVPVIIPQRKGDPIIFDRDEFPRAGVTADKLAKLKPAFKKDGTVTAGNASGINDGAAALVLMSQRKSGRIRYEANGRFTWYWGLPVWTLALWELALFQQLRKPWQKQVYPFMIWILLKQMKHLLHKPFAVGHDLEIPNEKLNVNGGAIALGHPIGASGTRIIVTLLHEMKRQNLQYGLATLCIGGGMGIATGLEME